ncbi:FMN-binding protein [Fundicoccus culcitae]|uniref:FMN-binding protein n=1 Tax=Fundicoccus culcitae TaxID=2969821 RepID=A0ABY5P7U6_9LACT|nr:FMN-binding protein [Fundicoccus culcitae]UUX34812.1 FMN-binding protein [Fundicoccus culcitae]
MQANSIIKHMNGLGSQAEAIIPTIIEEQSIEVEAVSGATVFSIAIKQAVQEAINSVYL